MTMKGAILPTILVLSLLPAAGCVSRTPAEESTPEGAAILQARELPEDRVAMEAPPEEEAELTPIPEALDLDTAILIALERNESVIQASQGIAIAEADTSATYGQMFLPKIVSRLGWTGNSPQPGILTPDGGSIPFRDKEWFEASLGVRVPIYHPANSGYLYEANALGRDVARLGMLRTEQQIRFVVAQAFFRRLSLERQRDVVRDFIRSLESQEKDIQARVDAGAAIENDTLKVQLELTRQKQGLVEIENAIEIAAMRLNTFLGLPYDEAYELAWERPFAEVDLPPAEALVHRAREVRPDLRAQEIGLHQLKLIRRGELARFGPSVDAFASATFTDTEVFDTNTLATIGIGLTWEMFDGGVRRHRAAKALHELYRAASRLRDAKRSVALDVEESLRELENQASAVALGQAAVAQATENLRVQRALYRNNRSTANDLLEAEVQLNGARNTVVQATYAYEIAIGRLEAAVGEEREAIRTGGGETPVPEDG
jgi:outer membrane protein